jgi:cyclase
MCQVDRRGFLATGAALATSALGPAAEGLSAQAAAAPEGFVLRDIAPGVRLAEGDAVGKGYSNNGWIVLEDYVLVVDATYPSGASGLLQLIRATTDRPVRFAFDTHHHGDHAYGNQVFVENGAVPVAHTGVIDEMKRLETGYYGGGPGAWEGAVKSRADLGTSRLKPPSVLFPRELIFDDGRHRVELMHLGVAHTHGDAVAWLPKERILFAGDVCVNEKV